MKTLSVILSMALSAAGLMLAGTLAAGHALGRILPCGTGGGCETVARDPSAFFAGIPVAYFGVLGYLVLLLLALGRALGRSPRMMVWTAFLVSLFGVGASGWLTWHSITALHTTCAWCLTSAIVMVLSMLVNLEAVISKREEGLAGGVKLFGALLMAAICGVALTTQLSSPRPPDLTLDSASTSLIPGDAPVRGAKDAPVTIVEFADLSCSACKDMHGRLGKLIEHHPGRVRLVFRHLPLTKLEGHETSMDAAILAVVADRQSKFWPFVDAVYADKEHLTKPELAKLFEAATGLSEDSPEVAALRSGAKARVKVDIDFAEQAKIVQTPTYIVLVHGELAGVATSADLLALLSRPQVLRELESK